MKKIQFIFGLCFVAIASSLFAQENWKMMSDLEYHYQRADYWRSRLNQDSAAYEDSILQARTLYYTSTEPKTLRESFKYLKYYDGFTVLTSDDHAFRIYEWDEGTTQQHKYINVFQYKFDANKVESTPVMPGNDARTEQSRQYTDLYTLKSKGKVYYLATYLVRRDKNDYSVGVEVFSKNDQGLSDSTHIIVTNTYGTAVRNLEYALIDGSGATSHSIYYNKFRKTLYVPIVWSDGVVSTAYTQYRFRDDYFTEVRGGKK